MYWLISTLIIAVMLAVLAITSSMALPDNALFSMLNDVFTPLSLIVMAIVLLLLMPYRSLLSIESRSVSHRSWAFRTLLPAWRNASISLVIVILAGLLIVGSAWQAMSHYEQAIASKIDKSMRVQAWVTIEGISDSVYDNSVYDKAANSTTTSSGYRQVATLRVVSPLVSELTPQDLASRTRQYVESMADNSLSKISNNETKVAAEYRVLLNAYPKKSDTQSALAALNQLQPGDQLMMSLTLQPLASSEEVVNNPSGFDSYRWLRARHIDGVATIIAIGSPIDSSDSQALTVDSETYLQRLRLKIDQGRWQLRQHFYQDWALQTPDEQQAKAVTLSLLTGDRSLIHRETKDLYQLAGISHLLAISGTHVLFLAIMLAGMVTVLLNHTCPSWYRMIPRWQLRWLVMIAAAFIYALFTGFDVPAARTAWTLLAVGLVRLSLLPISTMRVLLALAILMAWFDPFVLWQAGYWLSFIAVALLLRYDDERQGETLRTPTKRDDNQDAWLMMTGMPTQIWLLFKRIFKLQCWLFIALLPVTLLLFGKASLWGLVINLFAIGLFGWVIVPLNLFAGLCYLLLPALADGIWALVSALVGALHELILWLTTLPALTGAWLYTPINTAMLLMTALILLPWLLPRGLISRWLAVPPLALLMMSVYANQQALSLSPTLYVLPLGDSYISAAVLQYPVDNSVSDNQYDTVSWLFLAEHRLQNTRTMPHSLTADSLSAIIEQQLGTLSIRRLEGISVQSNTPLLTDTIASSQSESSSDKTGIAARLPMVVALLSQNIPTSQYWQAGRHERWARYQQSGLAQSPLISAQNCQQGMTWQAADGSLTLHALTGWSDIKDSSVWDCSIAIDSAQPINVVQYNATNPQQSLSLTGQTLATTPPMPSSNDIHNKPMSSRLILDTSTHPRHWQLWSLLCLAEPFAIEPDGLVTWLSHSTSQVSAEILTTQRVGAVLTYDDKPLEVSMSLTATP